MRNTERCIESGGHRKYPTLPQLRTGNLPNYCCTTLAYVSKFFEISPVQHNQYKIREVERALRRRQNARSGIHAIEYCNSRYTVYTTTETLIIAQNTMECDGR